MMNIISEHRRKIPSVKFAESTTVSVPLPTDTSIKRMVLRLKGYARCTYSGGTPPVASEMGYLGRMLNRIQVSANGKDTVKNVNPYMLRMIQLLSKGVAGPRSFSTSASQPTTLVAGTERVQGPALDFPATTQYILLNEAVEINFEHPLAYGQGKQASIFHTKNFSSSELIFDFSSLSRLAQDGNAIAIAWDDINFVIDIQLIESPTLEEDPKNPFLYYKEVFSVLPIGGGGSDLSQKLTRGNNLTGLSFLALDGSVNAKLSDTIIQRLKVLYNSRSPVQDISWLENQDDNRVRYGIDAWKTAGNHPQKGFNHMNFMQYGLAGSGLPTQAFNELDLRIDSAPTSGFDAGVYTQQAQLMIHTHELVTK